MKFDVDFARRVLTSRWFVIAAGIWIQCVAGTSYTFGVYSQSIKLVLGYDQQKLDTLAFFKTIGANVGILSGLLYDVVPPWIVLLVAVAQNSFGYFMLWLAVTRRIEPPAFWQMCTYICVASNSATFFSTAVVVTNVKIFPNNRGMVIGLLKGFLGLSGAILTQFFYAVYPNDPSSYLLMVSWLPSVVTLLFMGVIRATPASAERDSANFSLLSTIATCLAAYLTGVIVLENIVTIRRIPSLFICLFLLGFLVLFFLVVVKMEWNAGQVHNRDSNTMPLLSDQETVSRRNSEPLDLRKDKEIGPNRTNGPSQPDGLIDELGSHDPEAGKYKHGEFESWQEDSKGAEVAHSRDGSESPKLGEEHTLHQAILSAEFWLLVIIMVCSMGSGTTAIDNMGQIGASLGYSQVHINTFISLISIWNFLGRFGAGVVSELLLHSKGISRPCCLALSLAVMCLGHLIMASAIPGSVYVGSIILGVCYGAQWSLMPSITSEIFGLQHFGTLFNTIAIASPMGAYVLSVRVAGYLYDTEAQRQQEGVPASLSMRLVDLATSNVGTHDPLLCHGPRCFRVTFIILAFICAFGCVISGWLFFRTKEFYSRLHERLHKYD